MKTIVNELRDELRAAHLIIHNALGVVTFDQKTKWATANHRAAVIEEWEGVTRAQIRAAVIGEDAPLMLCQELYRAHVIIANISRLLSPHQSSLWFAANYRDGVSAAQNREPIRVDARFAVLVRALDMDLPLQDATDDGASHSLPNTGVNGVGISRICGDSAKFDMHAFLRRQRAFSDRVFGPGRRTAGVCDHIRKELFEVEAAPNDVTEWIDVILLGLDGAARTGATPEQITDALAAKLETNERRTWPDWRTANSDRAIEHLSEGGCAA